MSIPSLTSRFHLASALVACLIAIAALMPPQAQAQPNGVVPSQFIAKLYSEALGRAPDPAGWNGWVNNFLENGCTPSSLQNAATTFYTVNEFTSLYASDTTYQAQVLALYRGVLNRDPDPGGLQAWANTAKSSGWNAVVSGIVGSGEFSGYQSMICSASQADYGFGGYGPPNFTTGLNPPPAPTPVSTGSGAGYVPPGGTNDETDLQNKLNSMSSGQTLCLSQDQLILLTSPLNIPTGVKLTTCGVAQGAIGGLPYAQMARLARNFGGANSGTTVTLGAQASMDYIWVDGQRNDLGVIAASGCSGTACNFNVVTAAQSTDVSYNRISETQGGMQLGLNQEPCSITVKYNLMTAYTATWTGNGTATDGIDVYCENATVTNNMVVDMTDVPIIVMADGTAGHTQHSQIMNNTIVQAGNNSNAPLCLDQNTNMPAGTYSFSGMLMADNALWTSSAATFDFGICAGTSPWFGNANTSTNGIFTNNYTPSPLSANVRAGIEVGDDTESVQVNVNQDGQHPFNVNVVNLPSNSIAAGCPGGAVIDDPNATGTFPPATFSGKFDSCIGNGTPGNNYQLADPNFATGNVWRGWAVGIGNGHGSLSDATIQDTWNGSVFTGYNQAPYALEITDNTQSYWISVFQSVYAPAGKTNYAATVWVKATGSLTGGGAYLAIFDPVPGGQGLLCAQYTTSQSWTQLSCSGSIPNDGQLQFQVSSGSGDANGDGQPAGTSVQFDAAQLTMQ